MPHALVLLMCLAAPAQAAGPVTLDFSRAGEGAHPALTAHAGSWNVADGVILICMRSSVSKADSSP